MPGDEISCQIFYSLDPCVDILTIDAATLIGIAYATNVIEMKACTD